LLEFSLFLPFSLSFFPLSLSLSLSFPLTFPLSELNLVYQKFVFTNKTLDMLKVQDSIAQISYNASNIEMKFAMYSHQFVKANND